MKHPGIHFSWSAMIKKPHITTDKITTVTEQCTLLAHTVSALVKENKFFMVIGGDHSSAIGTWSGVYEALHEPCGLIWIDAHMDSHTPETSPTGNIHGMPLAALLGYGALTLTQILSASTKLAPENVCLIGVRSFEPDEEALLKKLNVRIYFMDEVNKRGIKVVLEEARQHVTKYTKKYGITLDIDSIEPQDAPGTGALEPSGIRADALCDALDKVVAEDPLFIGAEIAEFDPTQDKNHKTEKLILPLIAAMVLKNNFKNQ
jgi:arginase